MEGALARMAAAELISVIVPTLNEEEHISLCIGAIRAELSNCEIIIVDGGSADSTVETARAAGVMVLNSCRGRGLQMNMGARVANGEILLFLHADTRLEKGWSAAMLASLGDRSVVGGAFSFRIDGDEMRYRLIEFWVRMRCALILLPYGDQGIFIRKGIFDSIGGYREIPIMEDVDLIEKVKKVGRMTILRKEARTDRRKWEREGWIRVSLMNQYIMALYKLGIDPGRLARKYYGEY